ncbi:hypothetical protein MD484_g2370, partial [Candolleomyces efflorescens]
MSHSNGYHEHASRTAHNHQPQLDSLSEELGLNQTLSPRTELLSPSATEERRRTHASGTHESRRRKPRRSSRKHERDGSHHGTGSSDTSQQRELIRIVLEQEAEADNLKKVLQTTLQQLDEVSQKVSDYERDTREAAERFKQLNDSRMAAEHNASTANQQLHLYQFQLSNAQKEILTAQETVKTLEKQKEEAEDMAARARARARKLHQKQLVLSAKEEGRRVGFEAGIKQAQEELFITATARRAMSQAQAGSRQKHRSLRTLEGPTPPLPQSPVEEPAPREDQTEALRDDSVPVDEQESTTAYSEIETLKSPIKPRTRYLPPSEDGNPRPSTSHDPRMRASTSQPQPQPSTSHQPPDPSYTPSIQPYPLDIPLHDQLPENSRWVTAREHREMFGSQTSNTNSLRSMPRPIQQPVPEPYAPPQHVNPAPHPALPRPMSTAPPPQPVFAVIPATPLGPGQTPPKRSGSGSARKLLRFPTMAKNKAQSWYRSFSLRKKSRPVIDPIDEEPEQLAPQRGRPNEDEAGSETNELYRTQPPAPMSWYQAPRPVSEVKSHKSHANTTKGPGHSMVALMEDGRPGERVSRASTRLSQLDMISSAPRGYQGETASISNQNNVKKLAQKLSIIKEDSQSRGMTPLAEQPYPMSMGGPITPFVLPPQSDSGHSKKRPSYIAVPNPPGFAPDDPTVQGNYHRFPNGVPLGIPQQPPPGRMPSHPTATPSSKRSEDIGINIQPATAALEPPQSTAPPFTGNHLTANYVWQRPEPSVDTIQVWSSGYAER